MEYIFESYLELDNDKWIMRGCISGECDSFVLGNILLSRQQAGVKNVFLCRSVGVCRSAIYHVESAGMQKFILWQGLFV